ncbi:MAG: formylglycine-generating enzyme family protein [Geminicoccaceae bacterium]
MGVCRTGGDHDRVFPAGAGCGSDDIAGKGLANCAGCRSEWDGQTAPVGSFADNKFGLHDTAGNVWEWVQDCWSESYEAPGHPDDGSAWTTGDCNRRVLRGGSWFIPPWFLRSAVRHREVADRRVNSFGFRVTRTLSRSESVTP